MRLRREAQERLRAKFGDGGLRGQGVSSTGSAYSSGSPAEASATAGGPDLTVAADVAYQVADVAWSYLKSGASVVASTSQQIITDPRVTETIRSSAAAVTSSVRKRTTAGCETFTPRTHSWIRSW